MDRLRNRSYKIFKCRAEGGENRGMKSGGSSGKEACNG
jgi:hypothetical protein